MITINAEKKAAIDARKVEPPRDALAELTALKAALIDKAVISKADVEAQAISADAAVKG